MKALQTAAVISIEEHNGLCSMWIETDGFEGTPGQFVNVYLPDASRLLPRPISICEHDGHRLRLVFQIAGGGTALLASLNPATNIKILGGLGHGYDIRPGGAPILVGGGIGIPPLIGLAGQIRLQKPEAEITAFLGGRTSGFLEYLGADFKKHDVSVVYATDDGSLGFHGNVAELIKSQKKKQPATGETARAEIYACGPRPMLKAVAALDGMAQVSMEERMACGIGACVGCVVKISGAYKKVCKDGPVFRGNEVDWDD